MSTIDLSLAANKPPKYGRKVVAAAGSNAGRRTGARQFKHGESPLPLDLSRTMNSAILRRARTSDSEPESLLAPEDLYIQIRSQQTRRLVIFLIDTSDSMGDGPTARISAALGASVAIASTSYLSRDQVCLITFRDREAQLIVPPTNSVTRLKQSLERLPVGGATPLSAGLQRAHQVVRQARIKNPHVTPMLVLISDGEATRALTEGVDPGDEALAFAKQLHQDQVQALVINTLGSGRTQGLMPRLAETLGTRCHHIHDLQARQIVDLIEENRKLLSS